MYSYSLKQSGNRFHQVIQKKNSYIAFGQYDTVGSCIQPICAKFDSLGNLMFWKSYRDTLKSYGLSMWNADVKTNDGGFIISGSIWEQPDLYKGFLLKLDSNLNMQWRRYYYDNNPNSSWIYSDYSFLSLKETPDNGFLATGIRYRNSGIATALVLKTDSLGNEEWVKTHLDNKFFSSYATSINLPSGEYVLGGGVDTTSNPINSDMVVSKIDSIGNIIWQKTFGGSKGDGNMMLQNHPDGSIMLFYTKSDSAVVSQGNYEGYYTLQFHKLSPVTGDTIWCLSYGSAKPYQTTYSFKVFPDGSALASGSYGTFWTDPWLLHLDKEGSIDWYKEYRPTYPVTTNFHNTIYDLQQTSDSGYIVTGEIRITDSVISNCSWLMKIDDQGNWQDSSTYIMPGVKLQPSIALYPNPASSQLTVSYFQEMEEAVLEIYNTLGVKQMEVKLPQGQSSYSFSVSHLAKGYYKAILKEKGNIRGQQGLVISE